MATSIVTILSGDQVLDNNGDPYSGAKLYFYDVGTTTPKTVYSDPELTVALPNPVISDSAGRFDFGIYLASRYKIILTTSADVTIESIDDIDAGKFDANGNFFNQDGLVVFPTMADAVASTTIVDGDTIVIKDRASSLWTVITGTTGSNIFDLIQCTGISTLQLELLLTVEGEVSADALGAIPDNSTDNSAVLSYANINYDKTVLSSGKYRIASTVEFDKWFAGNGKRETFVVSDDNITAFDYYAGDRVTSQKLTDMTIVSASYDADGKADATGIGIKVHGRPDFEKVEFFGFGQYNMVCPGDALSTPFTYHLILGRFIKCNFQTGGGVRFIHTGTGNNFSTTTTFTDCYIFACPNGFDAEVLKSSVLNNLVIENCDLGINLSGCDLVLNSCYYEKNGRPYIINNSSVIINKETFSNNDDPVVVKRNSATLPTGTITELDSSSIVSQSLGLYLDDPTSPAAETTQNSYAAKFVNTTKGLPIQFPLYPTAVGVNSDVEYPASIPVTQSAGGRFNRIMTVRLEPDGTTSYGDPSIYTASKISTGVYNIDFNDGIVITYASATPVININDAQQGLKAAMQVTSPKYNNFLNNRVTDRVRFNVTNSAGTFTDAILLVIIHFDWD